MLTSVFLMGCGSSAKNSSESEETVLENKLGKYKKYGKINTFVPIK